MKRLVLLFMFVLSFVYFAYGEEWIYVCNDDDGWTYWYAKDFEKTKSGTYRVRTKWHRPTKSYYTGNGTYDIAEEMDFITMYEISNDLKRYRYIGELKIDKYGKVVNQSYNDNNYFETLDLHYKEPKWKVLKALLTHILRN